MKRLGYVPALDGLRGLAILLVIGEHYFHVPASGGSTGVGLFFVLSGFLITSLLLEEHAETGRIRLRAFYARRARRLLPALALMLVAYLVGAAAQGRTHDALRAVAAGGFYTANVAQSYWPHLIGREPIGPLWSLAEEEQFYLLWPALLIVVLVMGWRWRRVKTALLIAILAICAERFWLAFATHSTAARVYASPESAADGLLAGVLLAFILAKRQHPLRENADELALAALVLLGLVTVVAFSVDVYGPIIDCAGAVLVALAVDPTTRVSKVLSWRPLVWIGLISYSVYLWHMVVLSWFGYQEPWFSTGYHDRGVALALTVVIAFASYRWVEQPFRRARRGAAIRARPETSAPPSVAAART